ncbi:MAG TPA: hydroxymethylbilane synthase, partial [Ktedonobacteraceae bacterium]|nr:hydroxymethylbilane synthase [Ktedonobacteraceae bacterium]
MKKSITIGTRASKLAMIQTRSVIERLQQSWPGLEVKIEQIHTRGDLNTEAPLTQIGSDGVFVTEIERALQDGRIDLAVHSLKDLPTAQPVGLTIAVVGPREDVRDAMVSRAGGQSSAQDFQEQLARISEPLRIGTCSLRRTAQIRRLCPDAQILPLRGNVDTRLRKLDAGEYDAIVLAAAGLHRLDLPSRLAGRVSYFPIETLMPAPGQGALAVEIRDEPDMRELIQSIVNRDAQAATSAERMFMRRLGAGCYLPVAAHGEINGETLTLRGLVISLDGQRHVRVQQRIRWTAQTSIECAEQLGVTLAEEALAQGADEIIRELGIRGNTGDGINGKRILVTRSGEQASALSDRLRALGAIPIELPLIRIDPPEDWQPLDEALRRLCEHGEQPEPPYYAWLVFTSANGVTHFFGRLRAQGYDVQTIRGTRVAAIGSATQAALARQGISVDLVPGEYAAEELVAALVEDARKQHETLQGKRVLLARAAEARNVLPLGLQQEGALVDDVAVYRTSPTARDDETGREALSLLQTGRLDMLTFTSSSTVRNFVQWLGDLIRQNPHMKV